MADLLTGALWGGIALGLVLIGWWLQRPGPPDRVSAHWLDAHIRDRREE